MPGDTPERRAALLRLLDDWEAGRMTPPTAFGCPTWVEQDLWDDDLIASDRCDLYTLTPAGLAAARAVKGEAE